MNNEILMFVVSRITQMIEEANVQESDTRDDATKNKSLSPKQLYKK
jgi:hypothetical protein